MTLASLAANRYASPFREEVTSWLSRLASVSEQVPAQFAIRLASLHELSIGNQLQVESWLGVQSLWMYMEAVFSGGDIIKQLPVEAKRFHNIDKSFMKARFSNECFLGAKNDISFLPLPDHQFGKRNQERGGDLHWQHAAQDTPAAPDGAAGIVSEVAERIPGGEARRLSALLFRLGPHAAGDP